MFTIDIIKMYNPSFTQTRYGIVEIRNHDVEISKKIFNLIKEI